MQADGTHNLLCSLLEVIRRKHIRRIRKQTGRCIEIKPSSLEQPDDGLLLAPSVTVHTQRDLLARPPLQAPQECDDPPRSTLGAPDRGNQRVDDLV